MKWKSLKRGLAIMLSALMIASSASVYAEEPQTPSTQTEADNSAEDSQVEDSKSDEEPAPSEEEKPAESASGEEENPAESAPSEEENPAESAPSEEENPTESASSEEENPTESASSEEENPTESALIEEENPTESAPSEEENPTESTPIEEENPTESASAEETASDEESKPETELETETETETETDTEIETQEIVAFADIQDVVTFNTGNFAISVIPGDDYSDELFEACQDDGIYVVPFEEDGSFTIEAEADAFFPYEVQFQYDGKTENRWFLSPDDRTSVNGHTFNIHAEFSGDVVTQMKLSVAGKTIVVYPEGKNFTNNGGISTYSLLPLEEKNLRVDLSEFTPVELTMVSMKDVFAGERELKDTENIMWVTSDDDYTIRSPGDRMDLSSGYLWQMIVGSADQLDPDNVRYQISVTRNTSNEWLIPIVYTQSPAGERKEIPVLYYSQYANWLYCTVSGDDIGQTQEVYIGLKINPDVFANKRFSRMEVYAGELANAYDVQQAKKITSQIWDVDMTQKDAGYFVKISDLSNDSYTLVTYDDAQNVTGCLPFKMSLSKSDNSISVGSLFQRTENGRNYVQLSRSWRKTDEIEMYTVTLNKGYAADGKYCLTMTYNKNGVASNSEVTAAYVGIYDSIDEAKQANAVEVTSSLFNSDYTTGGYEADFSEGVDFSVFVEKDGGARYEKYYYNYKTIAAKEVHSITIGSLFQRTENGRNYVQLSRSWRKTDEIEMYTVTLNKGYAANGKYCLTMTYNNDGVASNSEVTAAYVGIYDSIDEAKQANAEEVTSLLFNSDYTTGGYKADFSEGKNFSVFVARNNPEKLEKYYYNYKVVEAEEPSEPEEPIKPEEPDLSGLEPIVQFDGLVDADGNEIAFYPVKDRMDSYSEYEFVTMIVEPDIDLSKIAPKFSLDDKYDGQGVNLYAAGSATPEVSGESYHDFSIGALQYTVATQTMIDGKDESRQRNYWLRILKKDSDKLYVNSLADPDAKTWVDEEGVKHSKREIHIDTYQGRIHNILLINMGAAAMTGLSAELSSDVLELDDYWTLKGKFALSGYSTIEKDTVHGELPNMAKICLRAQDGKVSDSDDLGTLTIKADNTPIMVFELTGSVGDPHIITQTIPSAVKYVPYGTMIQNSNKYYSWNTVMYKQTGGQLPEGMQILQSGELYGVPKEAGTFTFEVTMYNISSREDIQFQPDIKEFTLEVLENTDDNVEAATDKDYTITKRISDFSTDNIQDQLLVSNGLFDNYKFVYIDGNKLDEESDFTAESGSTRITIRSETLDRLDEGTHTIGVEFRDDNNELKRAAQNFTVEVKKDDPPDEDNKGDDPSDEDNKGDDPSDEDNKGDNPSDEGNKGDDPSDEDNKGDDSSDEDNKGDHSNKNEPGKDDGNNSDAGDGSNSSSTDGNAPVLIKPGEEQVNEMPVEGLVLKENYTMLQVDLSHDHLLRAVLLNRYYGHYVYLNAIFGIDFGLTIDMTGVPLMYDDREIHYTLITDPLIAPEFNVIHAIPNAIKPLGFEAIFNFHVGDEYIGKKAYIYVLNESNTGYDLVGTSVVNEIGNVAFVSANVTDVIIFIEK